MEKKIVPVEGSDEPLSVGDEIEVPSGPYELFRGTVVFIDYEASQVTARINVYGRVFEHIIPVTVHDE